MQCLIICSNPQSCGPFFEGWAHFFQGAPIFCSPRTCNLISFSKAESHKKNSNTVRSMSEAHFFFYLFQISVQNNYSKFAVVLCRVKPWDALILCYLTLWNSDCQRVPMGELYALMSRYLFLVIKHFPIDFCGLASNVHKKDKLPKRLFWHGVEHTFKKLLHFRRSLILMGYVQTFLLFSFLFYFFFFFNTQNNSL